MSTKSGNTLPKTLPGAVCAQMVHCGKPNCKCARGELHGPYFYHFERVNGVLVKRYVKKKDVAALRSACDVRREGEKRNRLAHKLNIRELVKFTELIRENEKQLFSFMEVQRAEAK